MTVKNALCLGWLLTAGTLTAPAQAPFAWETATPESQGMSSEKLEALKKELAARQTTVFLVIRNDKIVYEWYAPGEGADKPHGTASLAKAIIGGTAVGVAVTDGRLALTDKVAKYVPQWKDDPLKSRVEVRHLGSHTSGISDAEQDWMPHEKLTGWKGDFWKQLAPPRDQFTLSRDEAPILFEPGSRIRYANTGIAMMMYAVTASMRGAPENNARTLLHDRVFQPIGIPDNEWSCGYGKTVAVDGLPLVAAWGGASFSPRGLARLGRLIEHDGDWDGKRILSPEAVHQVTRSAGLPGGCGMGWWTNNVGRYQHIPTDACWGAGAGDQILLVIPSLKLILVRYGKLLTPVKDSTDVLVRFHDERTKIMFDPLVAAVTDRPAGLGAPYPASRVITGITWGPKETIARAAEDSDIWASTWADNGDMYTVYGDGTGFVPKVSEKLSQGLARITGGPDGFTGVNIRSATFDQKGNGPKGKKASGLLMVDGVLYALVRNAGNAQLAWSTDHGQTWTWANWKFTAGFGCPTFLNFGANYSGARDHYVYVYSHDSDSAYVPADRVALARVPKDQIRDHSAYEFLREVSADGTPVWTKEIGERGGAFNNPNRCYRVTVSYDAGLKRYLLCQAGADRRVEAGFGVFDAPTPWGPWTTVTYMPAWDVDPGETCSFPTKWMSSDGKTLHLVFSGGDSFNVRTATLTIARERGKGK
jgi:CubicO group peptidase (beta-lactamase class C family)